MEIGADMSKYRHAIFRFDDFEDIDETWRGGSYIGGLGSADGDAGIARQYRAAADLILSHSVKNDTVWEVVLPALFLYRHAIEIRLKAIVRPTKMSHNLVELARNLDGRLSKKLSASLPVELLDRIAELEAVDPRADAFRFTADTKNKPHFLNEVWVQLAYLREVVAWIEEELENAERLLSQ